MKVLYFHQHFNTREGSAGTRSYEFAKHLVETGDEVRIVCGRNIKSNFSERASGWRQDVELDGIQVSVINIPYGNHMSFSKRILAFLGYALWASIDGLTEKEVDIVFASSTPITVGIPALIVSRLKRKPLVFEVRDIWPESAVATGVLKNRLVIVLAEMFERLMYRSSRLVIAVSDLMKERMVEKTGMEADKISVVHIGADLDLFRQDCDNTFRVEHNLSGKFLACFPGAHGLANGLDLLVETSLLIDDDMRIVMIGDGGQKSRLIEKAKNIGASRILFFDPVPKTNLARILSTMDCGLQILEPLDVFRTVAPNKFFDFAASGLPIVCNFAGEVADHVTRFDAGVFVEPSTPEAVAKALIDLKRNPSRRHEMGRNARILAECYNRKQMAARFRQALVKSINGTGVPAVSTGKI